MRLRGRIAIDLGTVSTLVWVAGQGLVIEEPSAVALDAQTGKVAAVGSAADALAGKEPEHILVSYPLRDGVIADLNATAHMLHEFLRRACPSRVALRPSVVVCVPSRATAVERQSVNAVVKARHRRYRIRLLDEPVAAAAGAGVELSEGAGAFIVDIGGGTTEVAVIAGGRVVRARSLRLAGNAMDEAISRAVRSELGLAISRKAAQSLKMTLGLTGGPSGWAETVGIDVARRIPRAERVSGTLVATAIERPVSIIVRSVQEILSDIPAGLAEDVLRGKIRLAGGGALLPGLANRIESAVDIGTLVADDPLRCVIRGAAGILERDGGPDIVGLPWLGHGLAARGPAHRRGPLCHAVPAWWVWTYGR